MSGKATYQGIAYLEELLCSISDDFFILQLTIEAMTIVFINCTDGSKPVPNSRNEVKLTLIVKDTTGHTSDSCDRSTVSDTYL